MGKISSEQLFNKVRHCTRIGITSFITKSGSVLELRTYIAVTQALLN